tara:strand:+ start:127 stop:414 length:288 start_codon:yes stop_codon:yes gene_type:complete
MMFLGVWGANLLFASKTTFRFLSKRTDSIAVIALLMTILTVLSPCYVWSNPFFSMKQLIIAFSITLLLATAAFAGPIHGAACNGDLKQNWIKAWM